MRKISFILSLVLLTFFVFGSSIILSDETQLEIGTAFGNDFYLYATDPINDRVIMYDYDMNYLGVFFDKCDECPDWKLGNPVGIATDRLLNCVIVTDTEKKHAFHVDFRGESYWNQYESYRNEVLEPWDISACEIYDDIGNYAVDRAGNKLLRYDPPSIDFDKNANECNFCCILRFSVPSGYENNPAPVGDGEGEFNNPEGLMVDRRGYVLVADTGNNRIQKFRRNGEFVIEFGGADDDF